MNPVADDILPHSGGSQPPLHLLQDPDPNRHSGESRNLALFRIHFHRLMWSFLAIVILSELESKNFVALYPKS